MEEAGILEALGDFGREGGGYLGVGRCGGGFVVERWVVGVCHG